MGVGLPSSVMVFGLPSAFQVRVLVNLSRSAAGLAARS
jgi:hypothetical protein